MEMLLIVINTTHMLLDAVPVTILFVFFNWPPVVGAIYLKTFK